MPYVGHQHVSGINGLITSANFTDKFNSKVYKGLPNFTVVAGKTKLASIELSGIVTDTTSFSATHSAYTTATASGAGAGVDGIITALSLSGKLGGEVDFSVTVEGKKTSGASSTANPGTLMLIDDATITVDSATLKVLSFNLSANWSIEWIYDGAGLDFPYPKIADAIFTSFDGKLSVSLNEAPVLGDTLGEIDFAISVGKLSITGKAYEDENKAEDTPDGTYTTTRNFIISELTISTTA